MHELSLAEGLLGLIREEAARHGALRPVRVWVRCGALAQVLPEALELAFASLIQGTAYAGAALELIEDPLVLICGGCGAEFSPAAPAQLSPCPHCGQEFLHQVKSGQELFLDRLELE